MVPSLASKVSWQGNRVSSADLKDSFGETRQLPEVTWQEKKDGGSVPFCFLRV